MPGYKEKEQGPNGGIEDELRLLRVEEKDDEGGGAIYFNKGGQNNPKGGKGQLSLFHVGKGKDHQAGQEAIALLVLHGSEQLYKAEPENEALLLSGQRQLPDG